MGKKLKEKMDYIKELEDFSNSQTETIMKQRKEIINKNEKIKKLEESISEYIEDLEKSNRGLEAFIQTQEKHLRIAEKAIERKDKQFYGLRAAYQDEIINRGE